MMEKTIKSGAEGRKDGSYIITMEGLSVHVIASSRKSVSIEVRSDLTVCLRIPIWMKRQEAEAILQKKQNWIKTHLEEMEARHGDREAAPALSDRKIKELTEEAKKVIPLRVAYFAEKMSVTYGRITIRNQKTRWGSCSSKGNLNFNCQLMLMPDEVIDYVVVHELCHRVHMNHSGEFWKLVKQVMPDYEERRRLLREYAKTKV